MKKWIRKISIGVFIMIFVSSATLLFIMECSDGEDMEEYKNKAEDDSAGELAENPINWDKLKNTDVYAWVNVPGTLVDYPVASAPKGEDEDYYLHYDMKKQYDFAGMIYSRRANHNNFSDPVTVLYGHNMRNGSMFGTLNRFEDLSFFEGHETIYIYMPGKILTYQIISAGHSDNRDILGLYNYQSEDGMKEYINGFLFPSDGFVRSGVEVNASDKFLVLSTCTTASTERRLVQAVFLSSEDTK